MVRLARTNLDGVYEYEDYFVVRDHRPVKSNTVWDVWHRGDVIYTAARLGDVRQWLSLPFPVRIVSGWWNRLTNDVGLPGDGPSEDHPVTIPAGVELPSPDEAGMFETVERV